MSWQSINGGWIPKERHHVHGQWNVVRKSILMCWWVDRVKSFTIVTYRTWPCLYCIVYSSLPLSFTFFYVDLNIVSIRWYILLTFSCRLPLSFFLDRRCSPVPAVPNAVPDTTLALEGTRVTYSCVYGYEMSEESEHQSLWCDGQNWRGTVPFCEGNWSERGLLFAFV